MTLKSDKPCVVLVSGGLDSAVTLAIAVDRGFVAHGLTVRYGQRHAIEIASARKVFNAIGGGDHKTIDLDLRLFGGSALTADLAVPKGTIPEEGIAVPSTYVPARNTIFLSLALAWAETLGARDIFTGISSVDYSGYPDCRPRFVEAFEQVANLGTKAGDTGQAFKIHTPLIQLTKGETVKKGLELGVDFGLTWTCYDPSPKGLPCGECEACYLRAKGFIEAGVVDPLLDEF
ncbi:MAG: 7-cyano-7-deazaguanine synthase QueC [Proteobacteria bacterium]|nr:7-cyano-7-deazaguanine synthase QueC [Pseudomonadota bacterium]